ncbi:hypothetical protein P7L78_09105 [Tistrella bauzanensis]|uniref:hypothetical protein n=1 Tax=Tistrella TaxID=171436 RepID=UPI0031F662E4
MDDDLKKLREARAMTARMKSRMLKAQQVAEYSKRMFYKALDEEDKTFHRVIDAKLNGGRNAD